MWTFHSSMYDCYVDSCFAKATVYIALVVMDHLGPEVFFSGPLLPLSGRKREMQTRRRCACYDNWLFCVQLIKRLALHSPNIFFKYLKVMQKTGVTPWNTTPTNQQGKPGDGTYALNAWKNQFISAQTLSHTCTTKARPRAMRTAGRWWRCSEKGRPVWFSLGFSPRPSGAPPSPHSLPTLAPSGLAVGA